MKCTAHKRNGEPCNAQAMKGKRVCRLHGGKSLSGLAHPNFKTGRYSKYLPERLMDRYQQAENDPELLELRSGISLLDARLTDVLQRVDTGESGKAWELAKAALHDLRDAGAKADAARAGVAMMELDRIINRGLSDSLAWAEIQVLLDGRRRLVESERKRLVDMQQMITAEKATLLITAITDVIRRNVTDRKQLNNIQIELAGLLTRQEPAVVEG